VRDALESRSSRSRIGVGLDEKLLHTQLRRAIEVHRTYRLVGAERNDPSNVAIDRAIDNILGAHDVGHDRLEWIVFARRNLLQGGGVNHDVDAAERARQAILVAHIPDEIADRAVLGLWEPLGHLVLFELIATDDDDPLRAVFVKQCSDTGLPKRSGPAGNQYRRVMPVDHDLSNLRDSDDGLVAWPANTVTSARTPRCPVPVAGDAIQGPHARGDACST